eukprot:14353771-Alexandrium_andersonii.AAC.1
MARSDRLGPAASLSACARPSVSDARADAPAGQGARAATARRGRGRARPPAREVVHEGHGEHTRRGKGRRA